MHKVTERVILTLEKLRYAAIDPDQEPDFAILLSYQDALEFYHDVQVQATFEIAHFAPLGPAMSVEKYHVRYPEIGHPPYPDGKHVVWCHLEGVKLAIKGRED